MHHPTPNLVHAAAHLVFSGVSVFIVAKVLPGVRVKSLGAALAFALVAALLNFAAFWLLAPLGWSLPMRGLGGFVLNGLIFLIAAQIVGGVKVSGCIMAAIAAFCVTFVTHVLQRMLGQFVP